MTFPKIGSGRRGKMTVTAFSGGMNRRNLPGEVKENQLANAKNVWLKDGLLHTRPALQAVDTATCDGTRTFSQNPHERYVMRQQDGLFYTGELLEDGGVSWNSGGIQSGGMRVPFDVTQLSGWSAGRGDGTILFSQDGSLLAPLAQGGYQSLEEFAYVPQILAGGTGAASILDPPPTVLPAEKRNLLTAAFRAGFTTNGVGKIFYLPIDELDRTHPVTATYQNSEGRTVTHTIEAGATLEMATRSDGLCMALSVFHRCVYFVDEDKVTILAPAGAGVSDNLMVHAYSAGVDTTLIGKMTIGCWFGGTNSGLIGGTRLFAAGHPQYPHRVYWSDTENPLYFPEDNYVGVGDSTKAITAFGKQGKMLVVFKEDELYAMTYLSRATADELAAVCLTLFPLHGEIGCDCPATIRLCQNKLAWLNSDGRVYTLIGDNAYSQCNVRCVSGLIETDLRKYGRETLKGASAVCMDGWYLLLVGNDILLLRYADTAFERLGSYATSDEMAQNGMVWYRWELPEEVSPERLVDAHGRAVLVDATGARYGFGGDTDRVLVTGVMVDREICGEFTTGFYDFGHADIRKRVRELTWEAGSETGCKMSVTYITDKGARAECRQVAIPAGNARDADFLRIYRMTPHTAHVRRFGMAMTVRGSAVIGTLSVRYDVENAVEKGG